MGTIIEKSRNELMQSYAQNSPISESDSGLSLVGLHKRLGGRQVISDVTLRVLPGELVSLLGPSGCGKTTTLRLIAGFLAPDSGEVWMDSKNVSTLGPEYRPSAMVFQNYALWPHMTVERNIAFPLQVARRPKEEIRERIDRVLELVNLTQRRKVRPSQLSGGEQQRAALARALVQEPSVLLLDEPLSNLDAKLRERVRDEIRQIQQRMHITTIMVTHDQQEAMAISDRIAVMHDGRLEQISCPKDLYDRPLTENIARFIGTMNEFDRVFASSSDDAKEHWLVRPEDVIYRALDEHGISGVSPSFTAKLARTVPHGRYEDLVFTAFDDVSIIALHNAGDGSVRVGDDMAITARRVYHYCNNQLQGVME